LKLPTLYCASVSQAPYHGHALVIRLVLTTDNQKVADHIMAEYSRTAVIAHISQATKGSQEGWGRPGKSEALTITARVVEVIVIDLDRDWLGDEESGSLVDWTRHPIHWVAKLA
jgi:hypothetical protein